MNDKEEIFIKYANASLKENPEEFYNLLTMADKCQFVIEGRRDRIERKLKPLTQFTCDEFTPYPEDKCQSEIERSKDRIERMLEHFVQFAKRDDPEKAHEIRTNYIDKMKYRWEYKESSGGPDPYGPQRHEIEMPLRDILRMQEMDIAFDAVYQYRDGYCESTPGYCVIKRDLLDEKYFCGPTRLKCYECNQLFLRKLLEEIIAGKPLSDIGKEGVLGEEGVLAELLYNSHNYIRTRVLLEDPSDEKGEKEVQAQVVLDIEAVHLGFNTFFVNSIVCYSLAHFLLNNDRRKLKRCPLCNKFFIGKADPRHKFCPDCSKKDKRSPEEINKYHRERRARKKQEKINADREDKIANYMTALNYSREEALAIIEADSKT
jgi:hypothetical protein